MAQYMSNYAVVFCATLLYMAIAHPFLFLWGLLLFLFSAATKSVPRDCVAEASPCARSLISLTLSLSLSQVREEASQRPKLDCCPVQAPQCQARARQLGC